MTVGDRSHFGCAAEGASCGGKVLPVQKKDWNFDACVALQCKAEIDRLLVDEDEIDLWMRHAAGLDRVLDGCFLA